MSNENWSDDMKIGFEQAKVPQKKLQHEVDKEAKRNPLDGIGEFFKKNKYGGSSEGGGDCGGGGGGDCGGGGGGY
jgi:hypothetical protein